MDETHGSKRGAAAFLFGGAFGAETFFSAAFFPLPFFPPGSFVVDGPAFDSEVDGLGCWQKKGGQNQTKLYEFIKCIPHEAEDVQGTLLLRHDL